MPCTSCMANYSRTRREYSCAKCGFGFCQRCLPHKFVIDASISKQPASVCINCFRLLNDTPARQSAANGKQHSWGREEGELPPPSLRSLLMKGGEKMQQSGRPTGGTGEWSDLEARLKRLNEPIESVEDEEGRGRKRNGEAEKRSEKGIEQLEERLAALRGLPVEVIRRPGLLVMNADDHGISKNAQVEDEEVRKMLEKAQDSIQMSTNYVLPTQKTTPEIRSETLGAGDNSRKSSSSLGTVNSSILNETIAELTKTKNGEEEETCSVDVDQQQQIYPSLSECVKRTLEDAAVVEREALEFIRVHGQDGEKAREMEKNQNISNNNIISQNLPSPSTSQQIQQQNRQENKSKIHKFLRIPRFLH